MSLSIGTNTSAMRAAEAVSISSRSMETSMERLSTGKRINASSDDAAGVAIASRLSAEIRGANQAIRNSLDGQALINTAEGAHKEVENILQRMREVAVQAANDTNNAQDRDNLQAEMNAMSSEIDRIAGTTTWAGANLMEDSNTKFSFQVGTATGTKNQIDVNIASVNTSGLLLNGGAAGQAAVTDVTSVRDLTDISVQEFTFTAGSATQTSTVTFNLAGADYAATTSAGSTATEIGAAVIAAVNDGTGTAGDGTAVHSFVAANTAGAVTFTLAGTTEALSVKIANNAFSHAALTADVSSISVEAGGGNSAAVNARNSISFIDNAIKTVNVQRSELGAVSNRLNHTVNNLTNISSNLSAAKGGIEDADFALETTNLAKNQILQQASTAMLAQANASKQNVLSLLQG